MRPLFVLFACTLGLSAAEVTPVKWSGAINVPDPVAVTVDEKGAVYVCATTRRKVGDLDIREHTQWIADDVALTSPLEKEAFYKRVMAPGVLRGPRGSVKDHNGDGSVDWKDLSFHKERVYKMVDTDGNGVADKITLFAEGFNSVGAGIAAGILYHDGWVYVTAQPDLWRLKDTDGDGVADVKELVVTGFGAHIAYAGHDMHGLRLGPDGRIYWTIGDKGSNVTSKEGKHFFYPHSGAVFRSEPDGSGFEVFASGLRNVQEIAFDDLGNIIGVDNDADQPKERERLVYVVEGSDTGWRNQHQYMKLNSRWMRENIWQPNGAPNQPLCYTPPVANYSDGPAGFLREPGHALDGSLRGQFILDQFPNGKMDAFALQPVDDSFKMVGLRTINQGIMGIGMAWGPDGKAYFADWIGGYPLDGKGAVWNMDVATKTDAVSKEILSLPLSTPLPKERLLALLGHPDQRVRVNATLRLDRLGAWADLMAVALNDKRERLARIHAIWGWGIGLRHGRLASLQGATQLLGDADDEIRVQTLKVLSEGRLPPPSRLTLETEISDAIAQKMVAQLASTNPRLRMQAGITLGRLGLGRVGLVATPAPIGAFLHDAAADLKMPWLRHGLVMGLVGTQRSEDLLKLAQGQEAAQATFATLALAKQRSPLLAQLLASPHQDVLNEAVRAIHDDEGIPAAQAALAQSLGRSTLPTTALRRVINQNLREGSPEAANRILRWLEAQPESTPLVDEALQALLLFELPPVLDLVDGTAKRYTKRDHPALAAVLRQGQAKLLALKNESLKAKAVEILVRYGLDVPTADLLKLAKDTKIGASVRLQVLRLLSAKTESPAAIKEALLAATNDESETTLRIEGMQLLAQVDPASALLVSRRFLDVAGSNLAEKQAAVRVLFASAEAAASQPRLTLVNKLLQPKFNESLRLDVFLAAQGSTEPAVKLALQRYLEATRKPEQLAAPGLPYELLLAGGDPVRGRALAQEHLAANCVACHRFESDEGSEVGPPLKKVGEQRTPAEIAESLINPSAKIVPGYGFETLTLKSGEVLAGSVLSETPLALRLRQADGVMKDVAPGAVVSRTPPLSMMPPMLGILTPDELRDVVAYLASLKTKAPKAKK